MKNRRKTPRYRTLLNGNLSTNGRKMTVQIENLSRGGARISLDKPLMDGDEVELSFLLMQNDARSEGTQFKAPGSVIWCTEDMEAGFQAGIEFDPLSPQISELLGGMLESYPPTR